MLSIMAWRSLAVDAESLFTALATASADHYDLEGYPGGFNVTSPFRLVAVFVAYLVDYLVNNSICRLKPEFVDRCIRLT